MHVSHRLSEANDPTPEDNDIIFLKQLITCLPSVIDVDGKKQKINSLNKEINMLKEKKNFYRSYPRYTCYR